MILRNYTCHRLIIARVMPVPVAMTSKATMTGYHQHRSGRCSVQQQRHQSAKKRWYLFIMERGALLRRGAMRGHGHLTIYTYFRRTGTPIIARRWPMRAGRRIHPAMLHRVGTVIPALVTKPSSAMITGLRLHPAILKKIPGKCGKRRQQVHTS